jgi:ribose transport system permease protein
VTTEAEATSAETEPSSAKRALVRLYQARTLIALLLLIGALTLLSDSFLSVQNFLNVGQQVAVLAIVAIGATFVIISGGIDLSVGSVLALSAAVFAALFATFGLPWPIAAILGLGVGAALGAVNGAAIVYGRLPPFIATLAMLSIARGLALVVTGGRPISGFPDSFRWIAGRELPFGLPFSVVLTVILYAIASLVLRRTVFGRATYAIGGNEEAARRAGIKVDRKKIAIYTLAGAMAALGGLVLTARLNSAQPQAGAGLELDVIAAVVIGGASLSGGIGTAFGTLIGALIMGFLRNGLNLLNVSSFWQQVAVGIVIALAVMTDTLRQRRQ